MRNLVIKEETLNKVLAVLAQLPYAQVAQIISEIQSGVVELSDWLARSAQETDHKNT
jgi:hypothetical protein